MNLLVGLKYVLQPLLISIVGVIFMMLCSSAHAGKAQKDIVVVTANYRLGVFGLLSLPELSKETAYSGGFILISLSVLISFK